MKGVQFLQVEILEAFEAAKTLAGFVRIDRRTSMGHLLDLWRTGVSMTPDGDSITGIFEDENPAELIESVLEWAGDRGRLWSGLVRAGLIRELGPGTRIGLEAFEIRGLKRYEELREKRKRDADRKRKERARNVSDGRPPDDTRTSRGRPRAEKRIEEKRIEKPPPFPPPATNLRVVPPPDAAPGEEGDQLEPEEPSPTATELLDLWQEARRRWGLGLEAKPARVPDATRLKYSRSEWVGAFDAYLDPKRSRGLQAAEDDWPLAALLAGSVLAKKAPKRAPRRVLCGSCGLPASLNGAGQPIRTAVGKATCYHCLASPTSAGGGA